MVLPSGYMNHPDRTQTSQSVKRASIDNAVQNPAKTNNSNGKKVLHKFWRSLTTQSSQKDIIESTDVRQTMKGRSAIRPEIAIPKIMLTAPDGAAVGLNHKHSAQRCSLYSGSFKANRKNEDRSHSTTTKYLRISNSTSKPLRPWTNRVQSRDTGLKSDITKIPYECNGVFDSPLKETRIRSFRAPSRYAYLKAQNTHNSDEKHTHPTDSCETSTYGNGESDCAHQNLTKDTVTCPELLDRHDKDDTDLLTETDVETVYAIFAHGNDKQTSTKYVRICDSTGSFVDDFLEEDKLYNDSCVGFQDIDLSIDPTTLLSLSDDGFL
ncbi:uncharacterized protein [Argopecten irradians]|uniref:uncharacterized protein n=1 Tax=Argopecten irradians TaxID=31199 RepID=UPI00371F89B5